jgi:hypothetical protein
MTDAVKSLGKFFQGFFTIVLFLWVFGLMIGLTRFLLTH